MTSATKRRIAGAVIVMFAIWLATYLDSLFVAGDIINDGDWKDVVYNAGANLLIVLMPVGMGLLLWDTALIQKPWLRQAEDTSKSTEEV